MLIRFWRLFYSRTPPIRDAAGRIKPGSVAELKRVRIGGIDQTLLIRGHDVGRPVLLVLHGGPGGSAMPLAHWFSHRLEEHFVVVHWDQRGAGKSYSPDIPLASMTTDRMVEDAREVVSWLLARFGQPRLFLLGHSWGTELGVLTLQRHPDLFAGYVGVAQVVHKRRAEEISFRFALEGARREGDRERLARLERLVPPEYGGSVEDLLFERACVTRYGGSLYNPADDKRFFWKVFESHEYSLRDLQRLKEGSAFSLNALWQERLDVNLCETAAELSVPVRFLHGRADRVTASELVQEYFDVLQAPSKKLIWFERSGHCPLFEEPDRFQQVVIEELGALTPEAG